MNVPDEITTEEELSKVLPQLVEYVVANGEVYRVDRDAFNSDVYLRKVDEIPSEYFERYD